MSRLGATIRRATPELIAELEVRPADTFLVVAE